MINQTQVRNQAQLISKINQIITKIAKYTLSNINFILIISKVKIVKTTKEAIQVHKLGRRLSMKESTPKNTRKSQRSLLKGLITVQAVALVMKNIILAKGLARENFKKFLMSKETLINKMNILISRSISFRHHHLYSKMKLSIPCHTSKEGT